MNNNVKRLSELGIACDDSEIELLRKENINLKRELEEKTKEIEIIRNNFDIAIKSIIESRKTIEESDQIIHPYVDGSAFNPNGYINNVNSGNSSAIGGFSSILYSNNIHRDCMMIERM